MLEKSNKSRIKVAMIGGGINSAIGRVHEIAMKMDCRFELVAGCFSRNLELNRQSGERYGVSKDRVYGSLAALLAHEADRIDAVVVATPIQVHYEQILAVIQHGLRVISDKPLVGTPAQCVEIRRQSKVENVEVYCIFNYTGYPAVREMRQRVRSGAIGKVFKVMAEMPQDSFMRMMNQGRVSAIQKWRLQDDDIACVTLDLYVHIHSLVGFVCEGRPEKVTAFTQSISGVSSGLIDEVDAFIRYDNAMQLNVWYGKVALGHRNGLRLRVLGTKGSLQWYQEEPETLIAADAQGNRMAIDRLTTGCEINAQDRYQRFKAGHPAGFIEAFANYYFDIAESIESGIQSPWLLPFEKVEEGLNVSAAIHESARKQTTIVILPISEN